MRAPCVPMALRSSADSQDSQIGLHIDCNNCSEVLSAWSNNNVCGDRRQYFIIVICRIWWTDFVNGEEPMMKCARVRWLVARIRQFPSSYEWRRVVNLNCKLRYGQLHLRQVMNQLPPAISGSYVLDSASSDCTHRVKSIFSSLKRTKTSGKSDDRMADFPCSPRHQHVYWLSLFNSCVFFFIPTFRIRSRRSWICS